MGQRRSIIHVVQPPRLRPSSTTAAYIACKCSPASRFEFDSKTCKPYNCWTGTSRRPKP